MQLYVFLNHAMNKPNSCVSLLAHNRSQSALNEMYQAAHKIGDAFTGFVGELQQRGKYDLVAI